MDKFEGSLKRGPRICRECDSCHEVRIKKLVDGDYRYVIYNQCWGVSEPFFINSKDLDKPCSQYEDAADYKVFKSMKELVKLLTKEEKEELVNILSKGK